MHLRCLKPILHVSKQTSLLGCADLELLVNLMAMDGDRSDVTLKTELTARKPKLKARSCFFHSGNSPHPNKKTGPRTACLLLSVTFILCIRQKVRSNLTCLDQCNHIRKWGILKSPAVEPLIGRNPFHDPGIL